MAALGLGLRLSQDVAEACRKRERQATGDASLAACSFVSCATVTTQRMRDGRTSSQQHGRPSVSALTSTYLVCSVPTRHQPLGSTEEDRLPYIALIIAWFWLVLCHCQGSSNMKWLLLYKFIRVLQYEIVFTLQDYQGVRRYGTYHYTRAERKLSILAIVFVQMDS